MSDQSIQQGLHCILCTQSPFCHLQLSIMNMSRADDTVALFKVFEGSKVWGGLQKAAGHVSAFLLPT